MRAQGFPLNGKSLAVLLIACAVLLPGLGWRDHWEAAEGRPPLVAVDMVETGRWHPPYLQGAPYLNKPPLFHSMVALCFWTFDDRSELVARLPAVLAAILMIMLSSSTAVKLAGPPAGMLTSLGLLLCYGVFSKARSCELETTLAACVSGIAWAAIPTKGEGRGPATRILAATAFGAIAALAKGHVIFLFIAALLVGPGIRPSRGRVLEWKPLMASLAGAIIALACFYLPLFLDAERGAELRSILSLKNNRHEHGPLYYLGSLPLLLLPALIAVPWVMKSRRFIVRGARELLFSALLVLVTLSIPESKQSHYLLPILPWIVIAGGCALSGVPAWRTRIMLIAAALLVILFAGDTLWARHRNPEKSKAEPMRKFAEIARDAPIASMDDHPVTNFYLGRRDAPVLLDPSAAREFLEKHPRGFLVIENDGDHPLPNPLANVNVAARWKSPSGNESFILLGPGAGR